MTRNAEIEATGRVWVAVFPGERRYVRQSATRGAAPPPQRHLITYRTKHDALDPFYPAKVRNHRVGSEPIHALIFQVEVANVTC